MKTPRIVVVGSVNVDLIVRGARFPARGETVSGGTFLMAGGGKGANQAVAAARLGAHVALVARVGRDMFGDGAVAQLGREGIDCAAVVRDETRATGVAAILVDGAGDNMISVAPGANRALEPDDVERAAAVLTAADVVLVQLEVPPAVVALTCRLAARAGVRVILDPAPAPAGPLDSALYADIALVKPNETEAERLTGIAVHDEASAHAAAARLISAGARHAIVTLGAKGAVWNDGARSGAVAAPAGDAIDTTAAGDAFAGGLASALARGAPLEKAVRYGCMVGALSTTRAGAQPSLPTGQELETFARSRGAELS
jgi:ribokinase